MHFITKYLLLIVNWIDGLAKRVRWSSFIYFNIAYNIKRIQRNFLKSIIIVFIVKLFYDSNLYMVLSLSSARKIKIVDVTGNSTGKDISFDAFENVNLIKMVN